MKKILIVFAHPSFELSRVHKRLISVATQVKNVTVNDIYQKYFDYDIDIEIEKKLLEQNDIIIWQHPFYWYSCPPLMKEWIDLVLEHGWAYGNQGRSLEGKWLFNTISSGGSFDAYTKEGLNKYSIKELIPPFEQTARLCRMNYLPPFIVHGTHKLEDEEIQMYADKYKNLLEGLVNEKFSMDELNSKFYLNDLFSN